MEWVKARYLDASALVKLVADDLDEQPGRDVLREYYWANPANLYATSYCVAEVFSAFKRKLSRGRISESEYLQYLKKFIEEIVGANLRIDEVPILTPIVLNEANRLIETHKIDFVDCLQIVTVLHGQFRVLGPNSKTILVTADRNLARAARAEGARVWECTTEPSPE